MTLTLPWRLVLFRFFVLLRFFPLAMLFTSFLFRWSPLGVYLFARLRHLCFPVLLHFRHLVFFAFFAFAIAVLPPSFRFCLIPFCSLSLLPLYAPPILNILVPHTGHVPVVAGRPFLMVIGFGFFISRLVLHFIQYACIVCFTSFISES